MYSIYHIIKNMNDDEMNIPPLICSSCNRFLSTKELLGHYLNVFKPSLAEPNPVKTKDYFVNTLKLHTSCCWKSMMTVHDHLEVSLVDSRNR